MKTLNTLQVQNKCSECQSRSESYFCNLRDSSLKVLDSLKIAHSYPKGTTLFMEGQPSNGVYFLCKGKVKLSTCSKDGKIIILHIAEPGELLGLSSVVTDSVHISTAEVIEPCRVNFIRNNDFLNFLQGNADAFECSKTTWKQLQYSLFTNLFARIIYFGCR
jgi:CRP/FNR family transcriptional regulator